MAALNRANDTHTVTVQRARNDDYFSRLVPDDYGRGNAAADGRTVHPLNVSMDRKTRLT